LDGKRGQTGMPAKPNAFNILLADMEEEMGKVKGGGVKLGGKRLYTLSYANDAGGRGRRNEEYDGKVGEVPR